MNILAAAAVDVSADGLRVAVDQGRAHIDANVISRGENPGSSLTVGLRPEHLVRCERGLRARVEASEILGAETIVHCVLQSGERLAASLRGLHRVSRGEPVGFEIHAEHVHVFDAEGNAFARDVDARMETPRVETLP
jgi:multiple sugar transport system ATP-binding protein